MDLVVAVLLLVVHQKAPKEDAKALVEQLRSDRIEERDEATAKLKALGKAGVPELEKVAKDEDAEVASRAKHLLRVIEILPTLTENLLKAMPGIDDRLAGGG